MSKEHVYQEPSSSVRQPSSLGTLLDVGTPLEYGRKIRLMHGKISQQQYTPEAVRYTANFGIKDVLRSPIR